jgi:hypothetical protein
MKGLLDWMMYHTGTGPYAVEAVRQRNAPQVPNVSAKGSRLPVSQSTKRIPGEMRRLEDVLARTKNKIGRKK